MNVEDTLRGHGIGVSGKGGGGNTILATYRNTVTLGTAKTNVGIGITKFDKNKDALLVFQGATYIEQGQEYTINVDGVSIDAASGQWGAGTIFNFVVLSSMPNTDALNTVMLSAAVAATVDGTANIVHGISAFNQTSDVLEVFYDNTLQYPGDNYNLAVDGLSINLIGWTLNNTQKIYFRCWKKVKQDLSQIDSVQLMDGAVTNVKLNADIKVGSLATLSTTTKVSVVAAINELFQSASNGKNSIATAITGMGVAAAGSDTFAQLATKIGNISKDANATAAQLLAGQTAYVGGAKVTGTMPNNGAVTITPSTANQAVAAGYHSGAGIVQGDVNLIAANILSGQSIFGVAGNVVAGKAYATGTLTTSSGSLTLAGLAFVPTLVVIYQTAPDTGGNGLLGYVAIFAKSGDVYMNGASDNGYGRLAANAPNPPNQYAGGGAGYATWTASGGTFVINTPQVGIPIRWYAFA